MLLKGPRLNLDAAPCASITSFGIWLCMYNSVVAIVSGIFAVLSDVLRYFDGHTVPRSSEIVVPSGRDDMVILLLGPACDFAETVFLAFCSTEFSSPFSEFVRGAT